ncbi:GTP-binding protein [Scenedesmus sp. PABB004]|nr:GTP-binding protein [Scenedesmus sp. PABB004]
MRALGGRAARALGGSAAGLLAGPAPWPVCWHRAGQHTAAPRRPHAPGRGAAAAAAPATAAARAAGGAAPSPPRADAAAASEGEDDGAGGALPHLVLELPEPTHVLVKSAEFVKSSVRVADCPPPKLPEFAVIGRSNVGKSSLINMLTNRKGLAMVSKEPGKTRCINHFLINGSWYLVDLPGYGYARTGRDTRAEFEAFTREYFTQRPSLAMVLLLVDSSIPPQDVDLRYAAWLGGRGVPFALVFTKADKRKKGGPKAGANVLAFKRALLDGHGFAAVPPTLVTSAASGGGKGELIAFIASLRGLTCHAAWGLAGALPHCPPAPAPPACGPDAGCEACDAGVARALLEQLNTARQANLELRARLLRAAHHRPVVLTNPLGGRHNTAWQLACAALAALAAALFVQGRVARARAASRYGELQQVLQLREALWRRELGTEVGRAAALQAKEAVWRRGVARLGAALEQRVAALAACRGGTPSAARLSDAGDVPAPSAAVKSDQQRASPVKAASDKPDQSPACDGGLQDDEPAGPDLFAQPLATDAAPRLAALQAGFASLSATAADLDDLRGAVEQLEQDAAEVARLQQRRDELGDAPAQLAALRAEAGGGAPESLAANLGQLQQQEEEAGKLRARIAGKLDVLRQQSRELEALQGQKKQLEKQVAEMQASVAGLPALQQQQEELAAAAAEAERLAALNSELRLIAINLDVLQEEQVTLSPQAERAQELRQLIQELEHDAAQLPTLKARRRGARRRAPPPRPARRRPPPRPPPCSRRRRAQAEHHLLLEQVQQLEVLRKENAEMAALVAQLAVLRGEQVQLHELCQQVEGLRADNATLRAKTARLPALQAEHTELKEAAEEAEALQQAVAALRDQADLADELRAEREDLAAAAADAGPLAAEVAALRGAAAEALEARAQLGELRAAQERLGECRAELAALAGTREELAAALAQQAELSAEVALLERDYDELAAQAARAAALQAEMPALEAQADMLDELELQHRKLGQLAEKCRALRAQNAHMAQEAAALPELKVAAAELQQQVSQLQAVKAQIQRLQEEGDAAYAEVQAHSGAPTPGSAGRAAPHGAAAAVRLSAAHIATTPPGDAHTPAPAEPAGALARGQAATPATAAAQLAAQLAAVSPSVLTPGVASAMAAAGAAAAGGAGGSLEVIRTKLAVLKEQIGAKTQRMSAEKQERIARQIAKLEHSLAYVERHRGRAEQAVRSHLGATPSPAASLASGGGAGGASAGSSAGAPARRGDGGAATPLGFGFTSGRAGAADGDGAAATPPARRAARPGGEASCGSTPFYTPTGRSGRGGGGDDCADDGGR